MVLASAALAFWSGGVYVVMMMTGNSNFISCDFVSVGDTNRVETGLSKVVEL